MTTGTEHNRLINESSPYLLQHAQNPVDWLPWGEEAFEKARVEDKPIFLSIGYATCHWCHVMAHESFEDPEVAEMLNETFVSIKVDREERPDVDNIYMTVCRLMTGGGGWPLTVIMTPDKKPFFAGTYFPKQTRFGRIGMLDLIPRIRHIWLTKRGEIESSGDRIVAAVKEISNESPGEALTESVLGLAYRQLVVGFDPQYGGFSKAPKFPTPHNMLFMLRYWNRTGDRKALEMVERTLQKMRLGGIYDQVGFGFHRYSTDEKWLVPHFEKMLYDQALMAMAYTEAYQATGKNEYETTARQIFTYVLRDMTSPEGGFYSAQDADSEGIEGKFYVWDEAEIKSVIGDEDTGLVRRIFNVRDDGNFDEEATGRRTGANILYLDASYEISAAKMNLREAELIEKVERIRNALFEVRRKRVPPLKDDKILADWNGLMIAALAKAARAFDEPDYANAAARAADFVLNSMTSPKGRLFHRYRNGDAGLNAHLDDYAFVVWGLIELYETTLDTKYLESALKLNGDMIEHFRDDERGGFYMTANDGEKLLVRPKEIYDGATPSGNSVAALNLMKLARITGNHELEERAAGIGAAFSDSITKAPIAHTMMMSALDFAMSPSLDVTIAGYENAADTMEMLKSLNGLYRPNMTIIFRPVDNESPITKIAPHTADRVDIDCRATAYVCADRSCSNPTNDIDEMLKLLNEERPDTGHN